MPDREHLPGRTLSRQSGLAVVTVAEDLAVAPVSPDLLAGVVAVLGHQVVQEHAHLVLEEADHPVQGIVAQLQIRIEQLMSGLSSTTRVGGWVT